MPPGLLIAFALVVGIIVAAPWIAAQRQNPDALADEPTQRFSNSLRILRRDILSPDKYDMVSTPLTRAAERYRLGQTARQAAKRRLTVMVSLAALTVLFFLLGLVSALPLLLTLIPFGLMAIFVCVARVSVVKMHQKLEAYASSLDEGFGDREDTEILDFSYEEQQSTEISVSLEAPAKKGIFWDPIPVTAPTYVQQPLLPRTVRTIDLSAPVVAKPLIPTADHPDDIIEESSEVSPIRVVGQ